MNLRGYNVLRIVLVVLFISILLITLIYETAFSLAILVYLGLSSGFLINRLILVTIAYIFPKKYQKYKNSYTIIMPVKNEDPKILEESIRMLIKQEGNKQILIGDDNSNVPISKVLSEDLKEFVQIIRSDVSIGKKEMQVKLLEKARNSIIVQIDSDVVLSTKRDLENLTGYFNSSNKIGIVNGRIRIKAKRNITEKLQEFQYLLANDIGRVGMGRFGINPCASGELIAFRLDVFKKFIEEYRKTEYLGQLMRFGEDRFMTNIFLREGYKSIVATEVICYTFPKKEFITLLKQQKRWKLSGIRESIRCFNEVPNVYLKIWSILNFTLPILCTLLFANILLYYLFYMNLFGIFALISSLLLISLVAEAPILIREPKWIILVVPFTIYNMIFITPMWILSSLKQNETGWGTR